MMRDAFGRPFGLRSPLDPWGLRRAPVPSVPERPAPRPAPPARPLSPRPFATSPFAPSPFDGGRADVARAEAARAETARAEAARAETARAEAARAETARAEAARAETARAEAARPGNPLAPEAPEGAGELAERQAELEASRARLTREAARERESDKLRLVAEVLPALDDLDRSIAAARQDGSVTPGLVEGFELVRARLERVLRGYGLERIDAVGERFDPSLHEAIAMVHVEDPEDAGVVVDEIERGYRAGDRVVRAARVRVGAAAPA